MKKFLLWTSTMVAFTLLVLSSCSKKEEPLAPIEDGMIIGGFDVGLGLPFGTYRHNMVDGEFVDWDLITGGAVEIKKGKAADELEFYIYAVFEDGSEENYYYGGKLLVSDLSSSAE